MGARGGELMVDEKCPICNEHLAWSRCAVRDKGDRIVYECAVGKIVRVYRKKEREAGEGVD